MMTLIEVENEFTMLTTGPINIFDFSKKSKVA